MIIKEIQEYGEVRTKARAYFCYTLGRNLPNKLPNIEIDTIIEPLKKLSQEMGNFDSIYILDPLGIQVTNTVSINPTYARKGAGDSRSDRAYYYRTIKENRCSITDLYPSLMTNELIVTISYPIYNDKHKLLYIVCIDISLENILKTVHPTSIDSVFGKVRKYAYGSFAFALGAVALLLFMQGVTQLLSNGFAFHTVSITDMFESTILLTLSLAIFDLVRAIFEEEVLSSNKKHEDGDIHKTMVRFLGSIIIALSIESLMLVFKFAITDSSKLLYAVYLIGGISILLVSLSIYLNAINNSSNKDKK
ncbi:N-linked glycosylation glycosyltransferase PglG [hydrothermal vent metagenome]|uniref:N-linked glycosylation glycosyltransferase PglG n=1 Tax=hydrothermal vent metagenome TaxID=652676 RepID=A0A1W1CGL1_9ZZZZ